MLLVCPKCSARYLVSSIALGDEGREVRCAKCEHEWFQDKDEVFLQKLENISPIIREDASDIAESEPELRNFLDEETNEDQHASRKHHIPDAVKPNNEKVNVPALSSSAMRTKSALQAKIMGAITGLLIFAVLFGCAFIYKQKIAAFWPPAVAIYNIAGVPIVLKGEGLVLENLSAKIVKGNDNANVLSLQGRVLNMSEKPQEIPKMLAKLRSTNGEDGAKWEIDSPMGLLNAGEAFTFKSEYPSVPKGVGSVNLSFIPEVQQ